EPFNTLLQVYYADEETEMLDLLQRYLKKWYRAMQAHPRWYNGHLKVSDDGYAPYYGYWAFEAAAVVFLLDIDDSLIEHLVYPKDLVAYGKFLRIAGKDTSASLRPKAIKI
ncbi:MAG: DUF1911 domain-containing protein, partial [Burkholderiales bacterium]|nr:DUF1911 domain-containing protein [Burkholderiales bacterium]